MNNTENFVDHVIRGEAKTLRDNAFTTIARTHATDGCSSTQGMAVCGDYIYSIQIKSDNSKCIMHRVHRFTGECCLMTDSTTGSTVFTNLRHANAMDFKVLDGKNCLFVSVSDKVIVWEIDDTVLRPYAEFSILYNGKPFITSAMNVYKIDDDKITFIFKWGRTLSTGSVPRGVTTGVMEATILCQLDASRVPLNGEEVNFSSFINQGLCCEGDIVLIPITGNHKDETINQAIILGYDISRANGANTLQPEPNLVFHMICEEYPGLFEVEDCDIADDGKMYFNANRWLEKWGADYDGVLVMNDYTFPVKK